jgi:hypothetical protein
MLRLALYLKTREQQRSIQALAKLTKIKLWSLHVEPGDAAVAVEAAWRYAAPGASGDQEKVQGQGECSWVVQQQEVRGTTCGGTSSRSSGRRGCSQYRCRDRSKHSFDVVPSAAVVAGAAAPAHVGPTPSLLLIGGHPFFLLGWVSPWSWSWIISKALLGPPGGTW